MTQPKEFWGVLELMGHVRTAGLVSEVEMFGAKMGRIDIPSKVVCDRCSGVGRITGEPGACLACDGDGCKDGFTTSYFGGSSVYRLTPCGEAEARAVAAGNQPQPVHRWEFPRNLLPAAAASGTLDEDDRDLDGDADQPF